jgi:DNA-binding MarR family transcriptional regulator
MEISSGEKLLQAWLGMNACIKGDRIVTAMPFNEILVCNVLFRNREIGNECVTATDLCNETRLLKSQVNKIISDMENQGLVERVRSTDDKRMVYIRLRQEKIHIYLDEHQRILKLMDTIMTEMGEDNVIKLTELICEVTSIVDRVQKGE